MPQWLGPDDAPTGRVCAPVVPSSNPFAALSAADFRKRPAVLFERRGFACERLPAEYRDIHVGRIMSWRGVVLDRPPHALNRLLGAVAVSIVLASIDVPKS